MIRRAPATARSLAHSRRTRVGHQDSVGLDSLLCDPLEKYQEPLPFHGTVFEVPEKEIDQTYDFEGER